jgi:hypothetical protein
VGLLSRLRIVTIPNFGFVADIVSWEATRQPILGSQSAPRVHLSKRLATILTVAGLKKSISAAPKPKLPNSLDSLRRMNRTISGSVGIL